MADDKTILLKVELDVSELQRTQKIAAQEVEKLIKQKEVLKKSTNKDTIAIAKNKEELRIANKVLRDSTKAIIQNSDSLGKIKAENILLKSEIDKVSLSTENGADKVKRLNSIIDKNNAILEENASKLGKQKIGIGRYSEANKQLEKTLEDVKNGLLPLAKGVEVLDNAMSDLRKEGKENTVEFKELEKAQEDLSDETKKLSGDMEHLGKDILVEVSGSISKMEDKLYEMALAGDTTSKEFIELQNQTAEYKKIVIETDRSIDALAEQGKGLSGALALSETVVAGYQAYTGVTAILGDENEALLETITKLQAAQGVLNSIQIIKQKLQENSIRLQQAQTKAQGVYNFLIGKGTLLQKAQIAVQAAAAVGMKALNAVMNANPILLIVTGIGALVTALAIFSKSTEKAEEANNRLNDSLERENKLLDKQIERLRKTSSQRIQLAEAAGESEEKLHNLRIDQINEEEKIRKAQLLKLQEDVKRKSFVLNLALKEENEEVIESTKESLRESQEKYDELIAQNGDYRFQLDLENEKYNSKFENQEEKKHNDYLARVQERLSFSRRIKDEEIELINDTYEQEAAKLIESQFRRVEDLRFSKATEEEKARLTLLINENLKKDLKELDEKYKKLKEDAEKKELDDIQALNDEVLSAVEEQLKRELDAENKADEERRNRREKNEQEEEVLRQEKLQKIKDDATFALTVASQVSGALFQIKKNQIQKELNEDKEQYDEETKDLEDQLEANLISQAEFDAQKSALDSKARAKEKKLKEEAFKADKAAALISAAINTAVGVTAAAPVIPLMVLTAALGAVEIAAIASQPTPKFEKGGGLFGGKPHTQGGTKGYFDDGTNIEVEKDEMFFILNKNAKDKISQLSALNTSTGGVPLMENGAVMSFEGGGAVLNAASQSGNNVFNQQQQLNAAITALPPIFVAVEDINTGQGQRAEVVQRANF